MATDYNPARNEASKLPEQRAEDIAYTINHALACTTLDTLNTPVEMLSQKYLGKKISISYCPSCATGEHEQGYHKDADSTLKRGGRWLAAEWAGDWLGVIPTVAMQRFAPGLMDGIGHGLSYIAGPVFRYGAERSGQAWAQQHGYAADSPQAKARAEEIYHHEITHLPQAAVWTVASTGICLGTLRALGDNYTLASNAAAKLIGASASIAGVLGTRALAPETARSWDRWTSRNIYIPATKIVSGTVGVDGSVVERMAQKQEQFRQ